MMSLVMSISIPSRVIFWHGVQRDLLELGMKPAALNVLRTKFELLHASRNSYSIPRLSPEKQAILIEWNLQNLTKEQTTVINTKGTVDRPNGKTAKIKYLVVPLKSQEKPRYFWCGWNISMRFSDQTWKGNPYLLVGNFQNISNPQIFL